MPKNLRTFLDDMRRLYPSEVVTISKIVSPANHDVSAICKQLGALKKFPILVFDQALNLHGELSDVKLVMGLENSQKKIQVALGVAPDMDRAEMARECLRREARHVPPVIVEKNAAAVKEVINTGADVDLRELPLLRHHEMDGGPYIDMSSVARDRVSGTYNCSYHRMEVKDRNHTGFLMTLQHMWRIFRAYEEAGEECPVATVIGHHPAYQMGACYSGPFEVSEYDIIGGYLEEPLRVVPSETWGERLLVPADAEIVIEGALLPGKRMVEGPFGEVNGYLGSQGFQQSACYEVRAITRRRRALHTSIITPEGDKPWMDLAREGAYLRRAREAVPGVQAVCTSGRHALLNVFISMRKMSEGDPGRAAAAVLTWDWAKNVFVFDEDINVYDPTEILWALATRVQPHRQISIVDDMMRGSLLDPSMDHPRRTSVMIVDATKPLDRPFSPVSKCPDEALARIRLEEFVPGEVLQHIPADRTTYWA
ncbi:MAG TPA: UbiD family decarboxylase [Candidatus Binatia bacterium]|nr:UbiD family decarboxylase [Candidatus Binatia bacterium]